MKIHFPIYFESMIKRQYFVIFISISEKNSHFCFPTEIKIGSKNCNIQIFIYFKIEKKKFNNNLLLFVFFIQITR